MKKRLGIVLISSILAVGLCTSTTYAETFDFTNMTSAELEEVIDEIEDEIKANHDPTSTQEVAVKKAIISYVENYYGEDNVEWAWIDYNYTKEWDYYTMQTHADITKQDGGKAQYDIWGDVVANGDNYQVVYIKVGTEELYNNRQQGITDQRVLAMLGLSGTNGDAATATATQSDSAPATTTQPAATPETVEVIAVSATDLYNQFDENEVAANSKYKGNVIKVTGTVNKVYESWGYPYVSINADDWGIDTIECQFAKEDASSLVGLSSGQTVTIQGTCNGSGFACINVDDCSVVQ